MKLIHALDQFYYEQILKSLRQMNHNNVYGNLTYNSLLYMEVILYNEKCTASFLADTLHVARSAVTVKVNELVAKGIVTKTPCSTDKRVNYLSVSPEIGEDYKQLDVALNHAIAEIEDRFSASEVASFVDMLGIIRKHHQ
ncbi:MarR family winged helix-turn-helix transcriptional regulator [Sporosarcina sp. A2]|uniref:MarR family winged helix-turn-helix transcriptional regulator n=1 Tax=Sporosarcina sp. A2 TaxID=3393449 RepID=UPI003D7AB7AB